MKHFLPHAGKRADTESLLNTNFIQGVRILLWNLRKKTSRPRCLSNPNFLLPRISNQMALEA